MNLPNEDAIKEGLLKLAGLAEVETRILKIQYQLEEVPQNLKELQNRSGRMQTQRDEKKQRLSELESSSRLKEADLTDSKEKIKTRETRLYEIKTTKEYQATLKEIAQTKKQNQEAEAQLLQWMGEIETLKKELDPLEEEFSKLQGQLAEEEGRIGGTLETLNNELKEQTALKQQLFSTLDISLVARYEKILIRRQPAIAPVRSGTCQECNMNVPPQLYIELQRYRDIINCPSCHRILYIPNEV